MPATIKRIRRNRSPRPPFTSSADTSGRVSGGQCEECDFHKLPDGRCGVCMHAKRIEAEMLEMERIEA